MSTLELSLVRYRNTKGFTAGKLYADGTFIHYTLEDEEREVEGTHVCSWKIKKETAIPRGRYEIKLSLSPRFRRILPLLVAVEGYTGIRIHRGNKASHTEGCILVGQNDGNDRDSWIGNSAVAEKALIARLRVAQELKKQIFITIV